MPERVYLFLYLAARCLGDSRWLLTRFGSAPMHSRKRTISMFRFCNQTISLSFVINYQEKFFPINKFNEDFRKYFYNFLRIILIIKFLMVTYLPWQQYAEECCRWCPSHWCRPCRHKWPWWVRGCPSSHRREAAFASSCFVCRGSTQTPTMVTLIGDRKFSHVALLARSNQRNWTRSKMNFSNI